jgi:hypothetical protein
MKNGEHSFLMIKIKYSQIDEMSQLESLRGQVSKS